jgi:fatty-acyl-CoA synthase
MGPDIGAILQAITRHRVTVFFAPPTVWIGLLRHPDFERHDLSSLKKCYYGASIMPVEILKELLARLPQARIYNYYGQTELAPYHTLLKAEDALRKLGSAGRAGLHMETRLEADAGQVITSPGVPGEICGRGPQVMTLYFKEPDKTEEALAGGWFHSGDLGVLDEESYLTVVDRKKDMIKTGGENVASREVEEAIYRAPGVEEVAVVGVSDPKWIEAITAVIVPKSGATLTAEDILAHCRRELAPFKVPKQVIFVEALPKTPTGKILKRQLRLTLEPESD